MSGLSFADTLGMIRGKLRMTHAMMDPLDTDIPDVDEGLLSTKAVDLPE